MSHLPTPLVLILTIGMALAGCLAHWSSTAGAEPVAATLSSPVLEEGVLTVVHNQDYPPYEYVDSEGRSAGIAIDVITDVAKRLGLKVRFRPLPWLQVLEELEQGRADVAPCMLYSPARARKWAFSVAWGKSTSVVYVRKTSKFETVAGVVPKILTAPMGSVEYDALKLKGVKELVGAKSTEEALLKTLVGGADGAGCNRAVARVVFKQHVGMKSAMRELKPPLAVTLVMVASRKGNEQLLADISRVLLEMKRDGSLQRLTAGVTGEGSD